MRMQMILIQRYVCLIFLAVALNPGQPCSAQANALDTFADLIKCDNLLGKSPQAVLAVLGAPAVTRQMRQYDDSGHLLEWEYQGRGGSRLELNFFHKALLSVDVTTVKPQDELKAAFSACSPSSVKMTFLKGEAERVSSVVPTKMEEGLNISVTGTTRNGHLITARCKSLGNPPLIRMQVMNQNTSLYEDKYIANPGFAVNTVFSSRIVLTEGKGDLYEHYSWTKAEVFREAKEEKSSPARRGLMLLLTETLSENAGITGPFIVTVVTPKNSPWLF